MLCIYFRCCITTTNKNARRPTVQTRNINSISVRPLTVGAMDHYSVHTGPSAGRPAGAEPGMAFTLFSFLAGLALLPAAVEGGVERQERDLGTELDLPMDVFSLHHPFVRTNGVCSVACILFESVKFIAFYLL